MLLFCFYLLLCGWCCFAGYYYCYSTTLTPLLLLPHLFYYSYSTTTTLTLLLLYYSYSTTTLLLYCSLQLLLLYYSLLSNYYCSPLSAYVHCIYVDAVALPATWLPFLFPQNCCFFYYLWLVDAAALSNYYSYSTLYPTNGAARLG
jgi:hypothetical protein